MNLELLASLGWQEVPILIFAVLLGLVFFLVLRQNRKDYLDLKGTLASEDEECTS
jgi:preprotein translocase subunit YajC